MNYRTDIAYDEIHQLIDQKTVVSHQKKYNDVISHHIQVLHQDNPLEKEVGDYITVELPDLYDAHKRDECSIVVEDALKTLLPQDAKKILIVGLGNEQVTSDSLGPQVASMIFVTSHLIRLEKIESSINDVSVIVPKVMGQTGIETAEIVHAICHQINPDLVIAIDALATNSIERINRVIQVSNTGIRPGGGVRNHRKAIHYDDLHIPVIAIGVATVMSVQSLFQQILSETQVDSDEIASYFNSQTKFDMVMTPKEMDEDLHHLAQIIALAINQALFPRVEQF